MLGKISAFLVACMQPLIPVLVSVGMIRTLAVLFGPQMLGVLKESSGTFRILTLVGEAGFASLPIFIAWSASNYLKTNTILAVFYGAFLVYPGLTALLGSGEAVTLFGLPVPAAVYTSQVMPVMLIMLGMALVEKGLKRVLPEPAQFIGMPMLETLIMMVVMLCFIGPIGTIMGNYIAQGALVLYRTAGPLCVALVGAGAAAYACFGVYLAYTIFEKERRSEEIGFGALVTHALGGVAEPGMFSLLFTNGRLLIIQIIAAFLGSLWLGIRGVGLYSPGISNFMAVLQFAGGEQGNLQNAAIGCAVSFLTGFILTACMQIRSRRAGHLCRYGHR